MMAVLSMSFSGIFFRAFNVTAETVNAIMAIPTETRAALLNSGIFGVGEAVVAGVGVAADVGVEVAVDVDDGVGVGDGVDDDVAVGVGVDVDVRVNTETELTTKFVT